MYKVFIALVAVICVLRQVISAPQYESYYHQLPAGYVYRQPSYELEPPDGGYDARSVRKLEGPEAVAAPTYTNDGYYNAYTTVAQYYYQQHQQ